MNLSNKTVKAKTATQAIFLVCGLALSSWAPMVPLAKQRLALNDANLGLLLLLLGGGAILMMPISGFLSHRFGTRIVILIAGLATAITLPMLLLMQTSFWMGIILFIFGAGVGTVDVAMNAHGVNVQNQYGKHIMSSLHGLFSVGGLLGSIGLGFLIKIGLEPITAAITISAILIAIMALKYNDLFDKSTEKKENEMHADEPVTAKKQSTLSWLSGSVIFLGLMCFVVFLSEGAMLDWSAVFLKETRNVGIEMAGIGYAAFSIAMAVMRLLGDKIVAKLEGRTVVIGGALLAAAGIFIAVFSPWLLTSLLGFILLGIGAANIVPVFFSEGGRIKNVPATIAIPVISTMGYAGQLAGPALLGFIAFHFSLSIALAFIGLLLLFVAIAYLIKSPNAQKELS